MNMAAGGAVGWRNKGPLIKPLPPPPPPLQAPSQVRGRGRAEIRKQRRPRSSARRRQRQVLVLRSSTGARARWPFSRFLANPLEVRSGRATRRISYPSRKPQTLLLLVAHPPPRYLDPRKSSSNFKNAGMCSSETAQGVGAARIPSGSRARPTGAEQDNEGEDDGKGAWAAQGQGNSVLCRNP